MTARQTWRRETHHRPPVQVWGARGMVVSMHPEATRVAVDVLRQGGNAVDAAIALSAAISVLSPNWSGPGGDSAWLVYRAETGEVLQLDAYSRCPGGLTAEVLERTFGLGPAATPEAYDAEPEGYRQTGIVVSMVPGTPAAWVRLAERFGTIPLAKLLADAVELAEDGFPINRFLAEGLANNRDKLERFASSRKIFFDGDGELRREGETLVQRDLADTLRRIAEGGHGGFYRGPTAAAIERYSATHGGVYRAGDFETFDAAWRSPVRGSYRGFDVVVTGPPTAGIYLLMMLNILEPFAMAELGYHTAESLHVMIEAAKLARAERRSSAGDPDVVTVPVSALVDKERARRLSRGIRMGAARCIAPGGRSVRDSTTHFVVLDRNHNIVTATQTLGSEFGCGEVVEGTGLVMNDRSWWMALRGGCNVVAPGRRASIGHAPTIVLADGRPVMALGSPGGDGIIQYVLQTLVNVIDYGLDLQEAIEAPRFRSEDLCYQVAIEERMSADVRKTLERWGHHVVEFPGWTWRVGGVEGFAIDVRSGNVLGGHDPRRNSHACGVG